VARGATQGRIGRVDVSACPVWEHTDLNPCYIARQESRLEGSVSVDNDGPPDAVHRFTGRCTAYTSSAGHRKRLLIASDRPRNDSLVPSLLCDWYPRLSARNPSG
jgi:hypothetical protein